MSENTEKSSVINSIMSESDLESQSLNESGMLTVEPSAVTETAVGGNIIVHSTPIVAQAQLSETDVDSGVQLTPVSTKKNKQSEETDIMSVMLSQFERMNSNFETKFNVMNSDINSRFDDNDKRFDNNEIILNKMKSDFNYKLDQLTNDFNEQKIKCEQQNIQNEINFKEIKNQNIQLQQLSLIHI